MNESYQAIADEIIAMSEADQAMRKSKLWDESIDVKNTWRMKEIVGELAPRPIEDPENVDKRRAEVRLDTLAEYAAIMKSL